MMKFRHDTQIVLSVVLIVVLSSTSSFALLGNAPGKENEPVAKVRQINCQRLISEISSLNQRKEFSLGIWEPWKHLIIDRGLRKKRTAYNAAYKDILGKYDIFPGNISEVLDKIWVEVWEKVTKKYQFLMLINGPTIMVIEGWRLYKIRASEYAKQICYQSLGQ